MLTKTALQTIEIHSIILLLIWGAQQLMGDEGLYLPKW